MYSHMMVGANDLDKARKFYDATFKAMGGQEGRADDKGRLIYRHNGGIFIVTKPIDGKPAWCAHGSHRHALRGGPRTKARRRTAPGHRPM